MPQIPGKPPVQIRTERLLLVAGTAAMVQTEMEDRERFATLLGATVPPEWPPPLNDVESMRWTLRFLEANPVAGSWAKWYFVLVHRASGRTAIGNGGFKGKPTPEGRVEVGYSILEAHQRQGYAPEAVHGLVAWAFSHPEVRAVLAQTLPELRPSIRVLEKCGFRFVGPGTEEGAILYELPRDRSPETLGDRASLNRPGGP